MTDFRKKALLTAALAGSLCAGAVGPGWGHDHLGESQETARQDDHDEARDLVRHGNIRPLQEVLRAVQSYAAGEVIDVRLRSKDLHWIYTCKLVTPTGRRMVVEIDAATLAILEGEPEE